MLERNQMNDPARLPSYSGSGGRLAPLPATYEQNGFNDFREQEEPFNPLKLLLYVVKYRWLIIVAVAVALVVGVVVTWMQTPKYQATARAEIMVPAARALQDMDVFAQTNDLRTFETAREKLKSRDLARRVVAQLGLASNATFLFPAPDFAIGNVFSRVFGTAPRASVNDFSAESRENMAVGRLLDDLSISLVRGTSLLAVSFQSPDRQMAADIVNQVVRSYMDQQVDRTVETSQLARQFIEEQVSEVKGRLERSEAELVAYAREVGISSTGTDGSLVSANIRELNGALSAAIQARLTNERLVNQIEAGQSGSLTQVFENDTIKEMRTKLASLRADYTERLTTFKPDFPQMRSLAAQIGELENQINQGIAAVANNIRSSYEGSVQAEADIRAKLAELEQTQADFADKNIRYTILQRDVESNRAQYQALIGKANELTVVSELRRTNIEIVDLAVVPDAPVAPSLSRNLMTFLAGALVLAAGVIYLLELLNNKFNVPDQVESELRLPVLGIIPQVPVEDFQSALSDTRSPVSEAYRSLRTSLQFSGSDGAPRTLLITSAEPQESKSTSTFKLAEEFAAIGVKVLVVDADLRRPSLHRHFRVDNTTGLTNLLTNTVSADEVSSVFRATQFERVTFLPSGPMIPNPADMLSSHRMGAVIHACSKAYDMVLIDGPPVLGLSDALILSRLSEATLLVVSAHQVPRKTAKAALKRLHSAGGHIVGATLNKLDVKRIEYNYAYRNMYNSYYGYGSEQQSRLEGVKDGKTDDIGDQVIGSVRRLVDRLRPHRPKRS